MTAGDRHEGCQVRFSKVVGALLVSLYLLAVPREALANDIQITNLTVHPYSGGNGEVEFDITWQNSWRSTTEPYNWDAAWIFCKIRRNGGNWAHLKLNTSGHTIPSTPQAITTAMGLVDPTIAHNSSTNPAVGIFLHRTNDGFGTFTANDVRLQWNYSDNGASSGDVVEIRVFGIEMVYIPQAEFYAGDGSADSGGTASRLKEGSSDTDPWYINSENAISVTNASSNGYYYVTDPYADDDATGTAFSIPASYPKGYKALYMMKGEISQSQWVAFFNTLTSSQKTSRDTTGNKAGAGGKNSDSLLFRNNVSWTSGDATLPDQGGGATYAGVAMNYLSWSDFVSYLDWSGLRPMSELEYEKAARGPKTAVSGEYAWGSTNITQATSVSDAGLSSERAQAGSNINHDYGIVGPLRVGSFAKGVNTRGASGAGFYGAMDLSGNLLDMVVTIGNSTGRSFEGRYHGDGILSTSSGSEGDANVSTWPGVSTSVGSGARGGSWGYNDRARISDRTFGGRPMGWRSEDLGGRGVRLDPVTAGNGVN
ncbi:MAG: hypothetical protein RL518_1584 [Pseudomonadota bacterium]|jgi:hypothetical protein